MDRIISILFAFFAMMFSATAQAKPGLPSESEIIRVDCNTGTQCVQLNTGKDQTIEGLIARESIQATPELAALTTDAATGIAFNLTSGAVAVRGYLPGGGFEVIWPPDHNVDTVEQLRALSDARHWTREEFGLSARGRAKGAKFVVAKEIPLAQRLWLAGPEAIAAHLAQMGAGAAPSEAGQSPPSDDEFAAVQAALNQESRALTALRHAIADCSGRVQLNESGVPVCVAATGTLSGWNTVHLAVALMILAALIWWYWNKWTSEKRAHGKTRGSLTIAQDAHIALHTLYDALRVQVNRAKELLNAGEGETVDAAAAAISRLIDELRTQIRRARGALHAADDVDLAQAAQMRMDGLAAERTAHEQTQRNAAAREAELEGEIRKHVDAADRAHTTLAVVHAERDSERAARHQAGEQIEAHERDLAELSAHAGSILSGLCISEPTAQDGEALERLCAQVDALHQCVVEARAAAETYRQLALRTAAELDGLRGRVNGFAAVTEKITASLGGAEYAYDHPYARPRRKKDGQMVVSPHRAQFGALIGALRGVFPPPPPAPQPEQTRRRRVKKADAQAAATA